MRFGNVANFTNNFGQILILAENDGNIQFVASYHAYNIQAEAQVNSFFAFYRNIVL